MRRIFLISGIIISNIVYAQSISFLKLVSYAKYQDLKLIKGDLDNKGFIVNQNSAMLGGVKTENGKIASEVVSAQYVYGNDQFVMAYQSPIYYKVLLKQFAEVESTYLRTSGGISFYECENYIVGVNESESILGVYTLIK